jgi:hypothetical protein
MTTAYNDHVHSLVNRLGLALDIPADDLYAVFTGANIAPLTSDDWD